MARFLLTILGLLLLALGIWIVLACAAIVGAFIIGALAVGLLLFGLIILVLAIGEIAGARKAKSNNKDKSL